ncbi:DNA-directed RNA polymerase subunit alpha C-terminal domain-containing protein [Geodermatophilus sp. URMC 61]|uniref:DNA-directed RNA polymerase subunit alpha C-terminal domain-containing protein n=1 Tax=Geodermatophilus sp. URMC 61 TaxID=3423411 RepID=UPI00406D4632
MPTTSPGTRPGETVSDLGLPARAVTALTRAGITTTAQLAGLSRADLRAVNGLGPGSIAAIRRVVPEPPGRIPAGERGEPLPTPETHPDDEESPAAPAIPSFESLRSTRRRTTVDLIAPATPPPPDPPPTAPRPPDYADLWRLGVRVGQTAVTLPVRLTLCAVRAPVRRLRQLVGR